MVPLTLLLVLALSLAAPGVVLAGGDNEDSSNHAMPLLRMGAGTRALGMGGAATASGMDATAGYWNPAALCWACGTQISGMHALGMDEDRRLSFVAGSHWMEWGVLGASFLTAGMSDIDGYDASRNPTGTFSYGDLAFMLHGAIPTDFINFGATFKYLRQGLDADVEGDDGVGGYGFDFGAAAEPMEWLRIGVALHDVASKIGGDDDANEVPMNLRAGAALRPITGFTFAFDLERTQDEDDLKYHAGVEGAFPFRDDFAGAVRLGFNDGDFTAGLGVSVRMVEFNYAFLEEPEDWLGESHRIGVTLKFNEDECGGDYPFERTPRVRDRDLDGIPDAADACPSVAEDFDGFEDNDGCPDVDNDGDGVLDVNDRCPDRAEDFDGYEDHDGCPDIDNDGDGIRDQDDRCPNVAENFNSFQDTDGCPDEVPLELPLAHITFMTNSDQISGADPVPVLEEVARVMRENPEIRVRIEGHTDSVGSAEYNADLSLRRARTVMGYLVGKGIASNRFEVVGLGESEAIDTNDTAIGRARNRRIEFEVIK